jgi:hypothetical protein
MNAYDYLQKKGFIKVHQTSKHYNLSIAELLELLEGYALEKKADLKKSMHPSTKRDN